MGTGFRVRSPSLPGSDVLPTFLTSGSVECAEECFDFLLQDSVSRVSSHCLSPEVNISFPAIGVSALGLNRMS